MYYLMDKGKFPRPVKLGPKLAVWRRTDIDAYVAQFTNDGSEDKCTSTHDRAGCINVSNINDGGYYE